MAIYHLTASVISRGRGQSAVAAAAYRAGTRLRDERYAIVHRSSAEHGVAHAEILAPADAPAWVQDREALWNRVEAAEARRDSQLARAIEVALPVELNVPECVALLRDFVGREFVAKGMIADVSVRNDGRNPQAHILLTLRGISPSGFGLKERRWNGKGLLLEWRSAWADRVNEHLAGAGHAVRVDHRTLQAQQSDLMPVRRAGTALADVALPEYIAERIADGQRIARENGDAILEDPTIVLRALTHRSSTFTHEDLANFLRTRVAAVQFDAVLRAALGSEELMPLPGADGGAQRFTSRDMLEAARSLKNRLLSMVARRGHGVPDPQRDAAAARFSLNGAQRSAFERLLSDGDARTWVVAAPADAAPAVAAAADAAAADAAPAVAEPPDPRGVMAAACEAWRTAGWRVLGVARSRAAGAWDARSGVEPLLPGWDDGPGAPVARDVVLLVDGCEMLGLKELERIVAVADKARAKVVLAGDAVRLLALKNKSALGALLQSLAPGGV